MPTTGEEEERDHPEDVLADDVEVERHPDGDEEKAEQHVAKGLDVLLDLVAVFGLGDQHAGEKGAQRERETGDFGERREAERDQQEVQHEELGAPLPRDDVEPRPHRLLSREQDQRQREGGLDGREPQVLDQIAAAFRERRNDDEESHDREILEQQYAHDVAAVRRRELHLFREHLRHDGGRAHRERAAEREAYLPAETDEMDHDHREERGDRDLREAESEHRAAHRLQLRQAELEPDREHQEDDAELGEIADICAVRHPRERMRAGSDADNEIAEDRRQPDEPADDDRDDGAAQQDENELQRLRHRANSWRSRHCPALDLLTIECSTATLGYTLPMTTQGRR